MRIALVVVVVLLLLGCTQPEPSRDLPSSQVLPAEPVPAPVPVSSPASPSVSSTASVYPPARWTFLIYMNGDNDLESYALENFNALEQIGSDENVTILVQFDRIPGTYYGWWYAEEEDDGWSTAKRFRVMYDANNETLGSEELLDLGEVNMGDPTTLADFVQWGTRTFPAEHTMLIIWDHGYGWKASSLDVTDGEDLLTTQEIGRALNASGVRLDVVGFDLCLGSQIETASELSPYADYMVASKELELAPGWDYGFIGDVKAQPDAPPEQVGRWIVQRYRTRYAENPLYADTLSQFTLSVVDLRQMDEITRALRNTTLIVLSRFTRDDLTQALRRSREYGSYSALFLFSTGYVDFLELLRAMEQSMPDSQNAVDRIEALLDRAVVENYDSRRPTSAGAFSVYFPATGTVEEEYQTLRFAAHAGWYDYLDFINRELVEDTVAPLVHGFYASVSQGNVGQELVFEATVEGDDIQELFSFAAIRENDSLRVIHYRAFNPADYPQFEEEYPLSDSWDMRTFVVTDRTRSVIVWGQYDRTTEGYLAYGTYNGKKAVLHFDRTTFALDSVRLIEEDAEGRVSAVSQVAPHPGDRFEPDSLLLSSYPYNYTRTSLGVIEYNQSLWIDRAPVAPGTYRVGIGAIDHSGNVAWESQDVIVVSDASASPGCYWDFDCPSGYICDYARSTCVEDTYDYVECYSDWDCDWYGYCWYGECMY